MDPAEIKINKRNIWSAPTYRRFLLDSALTSLSDRMRGVVVDLGGKRKKIRGSFIPPTNGITRWITVNIEPEACPDILADITSLPLPDSSANIALMCETLEHVQDPIKALKEANRILMPGGILIGSVPFLYPVHADPSDYRRWTADGLELALSETGFEQIQVLGMGGSLGTIMLVIEVTVEQWLLTNNPNVPISFIARIALRFTRIFARFGAFIELLWLGSNVFQPTNKTTSGYLFLASKSLTSTGR